jgi:hypothetical protein
MHVLCSTEFTYRTSQQGAPPISLAPRLDQPATLFRRSWWDLLRSHAVKRAGYNGRKVYPLPMRQSHHVLYQKLKVVKGGQGCVNASHAGFDPALREPWSRVLDLLGDQQRPVPDLEKAHGKAWNTCSSTSFNNATIKNPRICHPAASIGGHQSHYPPKATRSLSLEEIRTLPLQMLHDTAFQISLIYSLCKRPKQAILHLFCVRDTQLRQPDLSLRNRYSGVHGKALIFTRFNYGCSSERHSDIFSSSHIYISCIP